MLRIFRLWAVSLSLCFAAALAGGRAEAQVVAHVLNVAGQWKLGDTGAAVSAGQGLSAGAKILAASNRPGDQITLVRDEDMSRIWTGCDASATNPCRNPVVVPGASSAPASGGFRAIVNAALAVLLSKPPAIDTHYAITLTRGDRKVQEMEAVVALDPAQGIVLPPAPGDMPAGQYTFSVARAGEKPMSTQTVQLTSEGTWRSLVCDAPGLYEVSIANGDGGQVADAMILVTANGQYQAQRDGFEAMKTRTASWTGPGARADGHLFLRAYLLQQSQALVSQAAGSQP